MVPARDDRWSGFRNTERLLAAHNELDIDAVVENRTHSPEQVVNSFIEGFNRREAARTLHFAHIMLPHAPWRFFASGATYGDGSLVEGLAWDRWINDRWLVTQAYQRHLLQVAYTDAVLGRMLRQLERDEIFDRALVVLVADHGASFRAGDTGRQPSRRNVADIARVPLLVKLPGQHEGRVDPRPVRTIDVLPTIAQVVGVRVPWSIDGHSLLRRSSTAANVEIGTRDGTKLVTSVEDVDRRQAATLRRKSAAFGEGATSLFAVGLHKNLLGMRVQDLELRESHARVQLDNPALFGNVRPGTGFVPALIRGTVEGEDVVTGAELAVAINGRIVALTRPARDGGGRFSALVPESAFRADSNRVRVVSIVDSPNGVRLSLLLETG